MFKRIVSGLLVWLLSAQLAFAAVAISNTASNSTSTMTSPATFSSQSVGTAAADRLVFVSIGVISGIGNANTIDSVTIGGVSATLADAQADGGAVLATYWAAVPSGTTATIVINSTGGTNFAPVGNLVISAYRVIGADTTTPVSSVQSNTTGTTLSVTVLSNGALEGSYNCTAGNIAPITWSGATKDVDVTGGAGVVSTANSTSSGSYTVQASGTTTCSGNVIIAGISIQAAGGVVAPTKEFMMMGFGQ